MDETQDSVKSRVSQLTSNLSPLRFRFSSAIAVDVALAVSPQLGGRSRSNSLRATPTYLSTKVPDQTLHLDVLVWIIQTCVQNGLHSMDDILHSLLCDGIALCQLINAINPDHPVKVFKNLHGRQDSFRRVENIASFLEGCKALGLNDSQLFDPLDLFMRHRMDNVSNCIRHLASIAQERSIKPTLQEAFASPFSPLKQEALRDHDVSTSHPNELEGLKKKLAKKEAQIQHLKSQLKRWEDMAKQFVNVDLEETSDVVGLIEARLKRLEQETASLAHEQELQRFQAQWDRLIKKLEQDIQQFRRLRMDHAGNCSDLVVKMGGLAGLLHELQSQLVVYKDSLSL
jgi:hypothetical protein